MLTVRILDFSLTAKIKISLSNVWANPTPEDLGHNNDNPDCYESTKGKLLSLGKMPITTLSSLPEMARRGVF